MEKSVFYLCSYHSHEVPYEGYNGQKGEMCTHQPNSCCWAQILPPITVPVNPATACRTLNSSCLFPVLCGQWAGTSKRPPPVLVIYKSYESHNDDTHIHAKHLHFYKWNTLRSVFFIPDFICEFCQCIQNSCIRIHKLSSPSPPPVFCNCFYTFYLFFNFAVSECGCQPDNIL